jgi:hypothetical protein
MPMPPHHAAQDLAARGLGVQDAAGRNRADGARDADDAELLIHLHLDKVRRVRVVGTSVIIDGAGGFLLLDAAHRALPHGVGDRHAARSVSLAHKLGVREHNLVRRGVGERRVRHLLGQSQQLVADRAGCGCDPVRHRACNPRSTFDRRLRKTRVAQLDADVVEWQPEHVGRNLRHDGVGAGANVGGGARHLGMAVGGEHDAHCDRTL